MRNVTLAFTLGILLGLGLSYLRKGEETMVLAPAAEGGEQAEQVPAAAPVKKPMVQLGVKKLGKIETVHWPKPVEEAAPSRVDAAEPEEEVKPARQLSFSVSAEQVELMETRFTELSQAVSLFREREGWIVRFQDSTNLLADVGIRDNDLIRFDEIHSMKQDPKTALLMGRLENILVNLER